MRLQRLRFVRSLEAPRRASFQNFSFFFLGGGVGEEETKKELPTIRRPDNEKQRKQQPTAVLMTGFMCVFA